MPDGLRINHELFSKNSASGNSVVCDVKNPKPAKSISSFSIWIVTGIENKFSEAIFEPKFSYRQTMWAFHIHFHNELEN